MANDEIGRFAIVQEIQRKSTDFVRRVIAPASLPALQQFPFGGRHLVGIDGTRTRQEQEEEALQLVVCGMWRQVRMESAQQDTGEQLSTNTNEAKVFKAHAAPHGLCENLINALKLLANQQTDGDSPIQSIVTGPHERTRKGIMDGVRSFNHSAVDVGHLRRGIRPFYLWKPNFCEDYSEDLTLRAKSKR